MTEEPTIMFFNKPSGWTYKDWLGSYARMLLAQMPKKVLKWVCSEDMTNEEKKEHLTHETTGGYLKVLDESKCSQSWWEGLSETQRDVIRAIPNFDPDIFKEITGIDTKGE